MSEIEIPQTVEPIIAWVRGMKPDAVVGQCRNPSQCIIAEYLQEKYPAYYFEVAPCTNGDGEVYFVSQLEYGQHVEEYTDKHVEQIIFDWGSEDVLPTALNALALIFDGVISDDDPRLEEGGEATMITAGEFLAKWEAQ